MCLKEANIFYVREYFIKKLDNADAINADLAISAVDACSALHGNAALVGANVVRRAVSVSVALDLDTLLVFAVCWHAWWAVRGDETLGAVDARVVLAVGSGSTFGEVLAVRVRGAADIHAHVVSAESSLQWPATMIVGSAFLFHTLITGAEAFAIGAHRDISLASLVSDALWFPAGIRSLVAELITCAVSNGCAFDVNTFLFDALVSLKTGVWEGVSAMFVFSAFLWNTLCRFAKRVLVTVRLVSTINGDTFVVLAVVLWSTVLVSFALDRDADIWFFTAFRAFSGADLVISIAVTVISAVECNTLVEFTSALAIGASRNRLCVQAMHVSSAVDSLAAIVDTSFLSTAVRVCSTFLDNADIIFAEAMVVFAAVYVEAHVVTSAFDWLASIGFTITELVGSAVGVVSALLSHARVLEALPVVVVGIFAILMRVAVDCVTEIVKADGILAILSAVSVIFAFDRNAVVLGANVGGIWTKVLAVIMTQAINVDTLVVVLFATANLFVTAVFSCSAFNIDAVVSGADLLFTAVCVIGTINILASVTIASLLESTMSIGSAFLSLTYVVLAETVSVSAVIPEGTFRESVARGVANALDIFTFSRDLVTLSDAIVGGTVGVFGAFSIDTLVFDTSLLISTSGVSDAADLFTFVVFADLAVSSIAVAVVSTFLQDALVVFAKMFIFTEGVASTSNLFASVSFSITDFRN